jgi:hypothetical protein
MIGFQHINNINEKNVISLLEDNMKSFLDYGFLKVGGFINLNTPTSGLYSNNLNKMTIAYDPVRPSGSVWETFRKDWVYETGIAHSGRYPVPISGIYLNNTFLPAPTGNGANSYFIDYPNGNIVFSSPKPANSNLALNYSYRNIQVYKANESSWWSEMQRYHYDSSNMNKTTGQIKIGQHKIQLPCIIIETTNRTSQEPYELGNTKNIINQDLLLYIYSENIMQRNNIIDILILQKDNQNYLYNINKVIKDQKWPLNSNGSVNTNGLNYDQILNNTNYLANTYYISNSIISELGSISSLLHYGVVRWSLKIYP